MRVLRTYMRQIFCDETLKGQVALSGLIKTPQSMNVGDFHQIVQNVPEIDQPEMFGLPSNIDRSVQRFNSNQVITDLKQLAAASAGELRFDIAKWSESLGPICQMWSTIFKPEVLNSIKITKKDLTCEDPVDQFVFMEMLSVRNILTQLNNQLTNIS